MIKRPSIFSCIAALLIMFSTVDVYADSLDKILKDGTLRVGVSLFTPWTLQDKSGQLSGFEVDVAKKIAQDMGVQPKFIIYEWENIIPALVKGEIDIIAGGMAITPARALKITFTNPYASSGITIATNIEKTQNIQNLNELNQKEVVFAVVSKSVASELVTSLFDKAEVKSYKSIDEAKQAVIDGVAHAIIASSPQPEFFALKNPDKIDIPLSKYLVSYKAGFGINNDQHKWLNFLNAWITARTADKWLPATHKYWFETLEWKKIESK